MSTPSGVDPESKTWPVVLAFAVEMERKLSLNRHKGDREGTIDETDTDARGPGLHGIHGGWIYDRPVSLCRRVDEEAKELLDEIETATTFGKVFAEAADVANMAMMVADAWGWQYDGHRGILERASGAPDDSD